MPGVAQPPAGSSGARPAAIARTQWATVTFAPELNVPRNASGVLEVDPIHATLAPLLDDSPLHPGLQIGLKPGMARFLVAAPKR